MKLRLAPASLATRIHQPLRFGAMWRGHELLLRIIQLAVIILLAGVGARLIAVGVSQGGQMLAQMLS